MGIVVRLIGLIETVGTGLVSSEAATQRQRKHTNKRITIADVFLTEDRMRERWISTSKKVWGRCERIRYCHKSSESSGFVSVEILFFSSHPIVFE